MPLNLPQYDAKLRRMPDGKLQVYDILRGKYVALTPEEIVRQHFVNFLINHRDYPQCRMANEIGLKYNNISRRCDTVIYDNTAHPLAIVEYKSTSVKITAKVFDQIVRYNMVMHVRWLMVSNGLESYCCRINDDGTYKFVKEIPTYAEIISPEQG